ncbi:MAG: hypothetical protein MMC23_009748 [Stictis urceolatum]|nr:hypothetical protein [Stictis urceolata]
MELDFAPYTPGFFTDAIGGPENVFDQSFSVDNAAMHKPSNLEWTSDTMDRFSCQQNIGPFHASPLPATVDYPDERPSSFDYGNEQFGLGVFAKQQRQLHPQEIPSGMQEFSQEPAFGSEQCVDFETTRLKTGHSTPSSNPPSAASVNELNADEVAPSNYRPRQGKFSKPTSRAEPSAADQQPQKRTRRTSKRNPPSLEAEREKREKLLERNRVAASKCRQKRKSYTNTLEEQARELQVRKSSLSALANSLKDEVLFLKGQMLRHSDCGCSRVRDYLNNEADSLPCARHSSLIRDPSTKLHTASVSSVSSSSANSMASSMPSFQQTMPPSPDEHSVLRESLVHDTG